MIIDMNNFCKRGFRVVAKDSVGKKYALYLNNDGNKELNLFSESELRLFLQWLIDASMGPVNIPLLKTDKFGLSFKSDKGEKIVKVAGKDIITQDIELFKKLVDFELIDVNLNYK